MSDSRGPAAETRHATAVAIEGAGILIEGPSGSGKSGLALQLIALGATLISDDRTLIELRDGQPWAVGPARLAGVIEARGLGLLRTPFIASAPLRLVVDMATTECKRMPENRTTTVLGHPVSTVSRVDAPYFAGSIVTLAKGGWYEE